MTDFIGRGLAVRSETGTRFGLHLDRSGSVALVDGEDNIAQSIEIILRTNPGERPMRPRFGCPLADFVFAPVDDRTKAELSLVVRESLTQWEPRIHVEDVVVTSSPEEPNCLHLDIVYRVRSDNDRRNLVFPFYVIPDDEAGT